jgi:hypothetical protein
MHKNLTQIKNSAQTYGMYIVSLISGTIMPYEFTYWMLHEASRRVSFQFSNLPGPKKPIVINGHRSKRAFVVINPAAESGASLTLYSHAGIFKFAVTTDSARVKDP